MTAHGCVVNLSNYRLLGETMKSIKSKMMPTKLMLSNFFLIPCVLCQSLSRVFNKVKSRSAHMKSHRPLDAEPKNKSSRPASDPHRNTPNSVEPHRTVDSVEQAMGRAMGITTTCVQSQLRPN